METYIGMSQFDNTLEMSQIKEMCSDKCPKSKW
jgi:hypothetical protein